MFMHLSTLFLAIQVERQSRELWIILTLALLIGLVGLVRALFPAAFGRIIGAFFDNTLFNQLIKEDGPFLSWPYLLLYVVMGFSMGMFGYQVFLTGFAASNLETDLHFFLLLSLAIMLLFGLKLIVIRLVSYVFDIRRLFRSYVIVLFLSYYMVAFLLLVFALLMSLLPYSEAEWLVPMALFLTGFLLIFRLGKAAFDILRNYRFPIFYFIVYLCTLELAPLLILIKIVSR